MKFINLTAHDIVLEDGERKMVVPSSGIVRCSQSYINQEPLDGWPVSKVSSGPPVGLPPPEEGVYYIVSNMVLQSLKDTRKDVISPDTGSSASRDNFGNVISVKGFLQ